MLGNTAVERASDPTATKMVRDALVELESAMANALARAQSEGEVTADIDPPAYANVLVATMQGLHVLARVETDPERLCGAVDAVLARVAAVQS